MNPRIDKLRKSLPEHLTVKQYCELRGCCAATAYKTMWIVPGLAVKIGRHTFINRDIALDAIDRDEQPRPWLQQRERTGTPELTAPEPTAGAAPAAVHSIDL
jgi:hypothetical protein